MSAARPRSTTGLRQFLNLEQQRDWIEGKTDCPTPTSARIHRASVQISGAISKAASPPAGEELWKFSASTAKAASRCRAGPSVATGRCPACRRPPTSRWSASMRAGWSFSRSTRTERGSVRDSSCIFRISRRTVHSSRARWTNLPRAQRHGTGRRRLFLPARGGHFRHQCAGRGLDPQIPRSRRIVRAVRTFNLTHMNRGRNAYQASHCYSVADHMVAR